MLSVYDTVGIMKIETLHIDDPSLLRDIEALAQRTGVPAEQAVAQAVRDKLDEPSGRAKVSREERRRRVQETLERIDKLPKSGRMLSDADLYDDDGLPR